MQLNASDAIGQFQWWPKHNLPLITHQNESETALACLTMVASYYDENVDFNKVKQVFNSSFSGCELTGIIKSSEEIALSCRVLKINNDEITHVKTPCIIQLTSSRFVVVKKVRKKQIEVHDPLLGAYQLSVEQALNDMTGVVLEFSATTVFDEEEDKEKKLKISDFWSKIDGLRRSLILIFSLSLLLQIFLLVSPYYIQLVVDDVILTSDNSLLSILAMGFLFVVLFEVTTTTLRSLALTQLGNQLNDQLGVNLYHHLLRLPLQYFESRHMGDIVSRFGSLQPIMRLVTHGIIEAIMDGIMAIVTIIIIFFYSPLLSAIVVTSVLAYGVARVLMYKPEKKLVKEEIEARANESSNFMESIRGIQTIKLFSSEQNRGSLWHNFHTLAVNKNIKLANVQVSQEGVNLFLFGVENILVIYLAAKLVITGGFSTGMLFAFIVYKNQFISKTTALIEKLFDLILLGLHLDRLADIVHTQKEHQAKNPTTKYTLKGKIDLKDVSFTYSDSSAETISQLNLTIYPRESVVITGPSASGKSTLLKLMLGLNKADQGVILIDGIPIEQIGSKQYRKQVAAVMQDDVLFSGSIAENIAFFEQPINMEFVVYCAELAAIDEDINKMPLGYDSLVADMGSRLSGGQKQRIILARALYKRPKILFMDEATSHLDANLETCINEAVKSLDITRVIVAHRKETIASADRVVSLLDLTQPCQEAVNDQDKSYQYAE